MLILRLFLVLVTLLLILSGGMYIFTRDRRYLKFAWQTLRFTAVLLLVFAALFVLEHYVLMGWRVLL
ncbi:MAG: hypothetical protein A3F73_02870 [Gallionellales bacterium RIFCSPLOWO2_12_FULL_59_22]|nr:MAG: hypothetical protein A3H99_12615 [Gallionellales bacterium RIFCSPLOWO2_02_FULL_59_110]OGT05409.1 MAG: hypothetical protein A2Z65_11585 [Gallionellales bacterium RIFCSPLOWO2_02_58_13]OGT10866.1 MAG: hypothetical protein A3F73_02870 [Gallionellales bacterium RIFCSPLOWO2_12_FULL_59_22]